MGPKRSLIRVLPAACAAGVFALLGRHDAAVGLGVLAVAVLLLGLLAPAVAQRLDRVLDRVAHAVATGVSTMLSWLAFSLGVLPAWALGKATRRTPLENPWTSSRSAWTIPPSNGVRGADDVPLGSGRSGAPDSLPVRRSLGRRIVATAVVLAVVAAGVMMALRRTAESQDAVLVEAPTAEENDADAADAGGPEVPAMLPRQAQVLDAAEFDGLAVDTYAHEDEPWAAAALGEVKQLPYSPDFFLGHRLGNFRGRYVNTLDGRRVSYTPEDPEITVWFFGGSTMLGIGQRDDHTLPSVVTRLAEQDGIRIRAVNFGVSGFVNWQSLEQFEQALTSDELEPPDLAVFYEGINELGLGTERTELGDVRPGTISRLGVSEQERTSIAEAVDNSGPMPWSEERTRAIIELSADQYSRGAELVDVLGTSFGVPVVRFWQPSPYAKVASPADDELWRRVGFDPAGLPASAANYREIWRRSDVDAIDLTRALDNVDRPVYLDHGHTNEYGARVIGEEMYAALQSQLAGLSE